LGKQICGLRNRLIVVGVDFRLSFYTHPGLLGRPQILGLPASASLRMHIAGPNYFIVATPLEVAMAARAIPGPLRFNRPLG